MATRLEKIFRTNTICMANDILNEINTFLESNTKSRPDKDEWAAVYSNITRSICGFYEKNNITDEEIKAALNRKGVKNAR